ncbi:MAG: hypothetical protein U0974_15730 [Gemmatimonadales bacterium]|nr:hypothetical protein [Gemmatimonadales bacterium]
MGTSVMTPATVRAVVRQSVGRRHRISRREAADLLLALAEAGLDLRNDCLPETWDWVWKSGSGTALPDQNPVQIERAAAAWADRVRGIQVVSVLAHWCTPHGSVRYDEPGSMAPGQQAAVSLVSASQVGREHDPITYLRRHADRVLVVADDALLNATATLED